MKPIIFIPAYNCEYTIGKVVLKAKKYGMVVVYDDGSTDLTGTIAEKVGAFVRRGTVNRGKGFALKKLFEEFGSCGRIVVTLDGDDQHNPDEIPKLIEPIVKGECDVTVGKRINQPKIRKTVGTLLNLFSNRKLDVQSGFRAYSPKILHKIKITEYGFGVDQQILDCLLKQGIKIKQVPIHAKYNRYSHSKNPVTHIKQIFRYLFFENPLLTFGIVGLLFSSLGILGIAHTIVTWNRYRELALGTLLISLSTIQIGSLIFFVGVIIHVITKNLKYFSKKNNSNEKRYRITKG